MIHELFPEKMDPDGIQAAFKKKAVDSADSILCISENTKKDLLNKYNYLESKVSVIYLASEISAEDADESLPVLEQPYFLYVGNRNEYKNVSTLLKSFSNFLKTHILKRCKFVRNCFFP